MKFACRLLQKRLDSRLRGNDGRFATVPFTADKEKSVQGQRLEAASLLARGLVHEFNNVLTTILFCAGFIRESLPDDSPLGPFAEDIFLASKKATFLTQQLLIFSNNDALWEEDVDMGEFIMQMKKLIKLLMGGHVELDVTMPPALWKVSINPICFEQVLISLLASARERLPAGGRLTLSGKNTTIGRQDYVAVCVSDTGDNQQKGGCSGLDMSNIHDIVNQRGGFVNVENGPGKGTTVTLYFPKAEASPGKLCKEETAP